MRNPWLKKAEQKKVAEAVEYYEENYIGFYTSRSESYVRHRDDLVEETLTVHVKAGQPFFYVS